MGHRRFPVLGVIVTLLYVFFRYTRLGIAMRATQQNQNAAKIMGIRTERVFTFAWGLSSLIGTVAAMFFAARATLDPSFMMEPFLRAFAAAVLGGLTSIPVVLVAARILADREPLGYMWPEWKPMSPLSSSCASCLPPSGLFAGIS